jgi:hypothetical protein
MAACLLRFGEREAGFQKCHESLTFAEMLLCVRRAIWKQWFFHISRETTQFSKLSRSLQETILYGLAPAA